MNKLLTVVLILCVLSFIALLILLITSTGCEDKHYLIDSGVIADVAFSVSAGGFGHPDLKQTTIWFKDGRVKSFDGIINGLRIGKCSYIYYHRHTFTNLSKFYVRGCKK
jgi:hypothetical protein